MTRNRQAEWPRVVVVSPAEYIPMFGGVEWSRHVSGRCVRIADCMVRGPVVGARLPLPPLRGTPRLESVWFGMVYLRRAGLLLV